jgi:hypothetical protein
VVSKISFFRAVLILSLSELELQKLVQTLGVILGVAFDPTIPFQKCLIASNDDCIFQGNRGAAACIGFRNVPSHGREIHPLIRSIAS